MKYTIQCEMMQIPGQLLQVAMQLLSSFSLFSFSALRTKPFTSRHGATVHFFADANPLFALIPEPTKRPLHNHYSIRSYMVQLFIKTRNNLHVLRMSLCASNKVTVQSQSGFVDHAVVQLFHSLLHATIQVYLISSLINCMCVVGII